MKNNVTARSLANLKPFRPGHAPHPRAGRPKGSRNISIVFQELLRAPYRSRDVSLKGKTGLEALAIKTLRRAIDKGGKDQELLLLWTEGPAPRGPIDDGERLADDLGEFSKSESEALVEIHVRAMRRKNGKPNPGKVITLEAD